MTCTTCGAVATPGATWCWQCYLPYVRAAGSIPPPPGYAPGQPSPWMPPPAYSQPPMPSYPGGSYSGEYSYGQPPPNWPASLGLVVPQIAVETGDLPQICVVSGVPTSNMVRMRWMWAPWWSLFLGLVIRYIVADKVAGYLPVAPRIRRRHALRLVGSVLGFFVGFVLMLGGLTSNQPFLALLGLVMFIGSPILMGVTGNLVKVKRAAPGYVAIKNAHPAFVRAFQAGRPAGATPYRSIPARFATGKGFYIALAIVAPLLIVAAVVSVIAKPRDGCGCDPSPIAVPPVVYTQPAGARCPQMGHFDVQPIEDEISQRDSALAGYGAAPTSSKAIVAIRKRDAGLVAGVNGWGLTSPDMAAKHQYLAALAAYDASLGSPGADGAASALQVQEDSLRAEFASVPGGCSAS